jgi:prefoldin subunit 5
MTIEDVEKRIAELDAKIEAYPYWGAALTAMAEEQRELRSLLRKLQAEAGNAIQLNGEIRNPK